MAIPGDRPVQRSAAEPEGYRCPGLSRSHLKEVFLNKLVCTGRLFSGFLWTRDWKL